MPDDTWHNSSKLAWTINLSGRFLNCHPLDWAITPKRYKELSLTRRHASTWHKKQHGSWQVPHSTVSSISFFSLANEDLKYSVNSWLSMPGLCITGHTELLVTGDEE